MFGVVGESFLVIESIYFAHLMQRASLCLQTYKSCLVTRRTKYDRCSIMSQDTTDMSQDKYTIVLRHDLSEATLSFVVFLSQDKVILKHTFSFNVGMSRDKYAYSSRYGLLSRNLTQIISRQYFPKVNFTFDVVCLKTYDHAPRDTILKAYFQGLETF